MKAFLENAKLATAITPTAGAAGTSDINGSTLDVAGFFAVVALVRMGAITAGAVTSLKWQHGDASDLSDAADVEGSAVTVADDDDDQIFALELVNPQKRYIRLVCDRGTQNAVVASAEYLLLAPKEAPVTQPAGVTVETLVAPASGTA